MRRGSSKRDGGRPGTPFVTQYRPPKYDRLVAVEPDGPDKIVLSFREDSSGPFGSVEVTRTLECTVYGFNPEEQREHRDVVMWWLRRGAIPEPPPKPDNPDEGDGEEGVRAPLPPLDPSPLEGRAIAPIADRERESLDPIPQSMLVEEAALISKLKAP